MAIVLLVGGCATPKQFPTPTVNGAPDAAVRAQLHVQTAIAEANALREFVLPPGIPHIDSIVSHLTGADFQLDENRKVLAWYSDEWGKQHDTIQASNAFLVRYHNQWIGDAAWRAWYWILGISVGVWVIWGAATAILSGIFPATTAVGWIASFGLRFLLGANPWIRLRDRIRTSRAAA